MQLNKVSGVIHNLKVVRIKQNILYGPQMREAQSVSAIVFGLAGMGGAAVQTAANADGGVDDVDMYSFEINGVRYAGCTRGASFQNGDDVEVVFEKRTGGLEVLGIRRPATRSIWLYPYMSRGSRAGLIHGLKLWAISSVVGTLICVIPSMDIISTRSVWFVALISPVVVAVGVAWFLPRLFRFAKAADEAFTAFGFNNPKQVDLHKTSKAHRKAHNTTWTAKNNLELWY